MVQYDEFRFIVQELLSVKISFVQRCTRLSVTFRFYKAQTKTYNSYI